MFLAVYYGLGHFHRFAFSGRDKGGKHSQEQLEQPGAVDIVAELTEDDIEFFSNYEKMTEEQLDAIGREQELLQEYSAKQLEANMLTVTVNGTELTRAV